MKLIQNIVLFVSIMMLVGCLKNEDVNLEATEVFDPTQEKTIIVPTATEIPNVSSPVPSDMFDEPEEDLFSPELAFISSGEFWMGSAPEVGYEICIQSRDGCKLDDFLDEAPVHVVSLADYWIFKYEVTNSDYRMCVESGGCSVPVFTEFFNSDYYSDHPVVHVDWFAASQFCEWAGGRLPTAAEWERAALGDTGWIYPWGNEADCEKANYSGCNFGEVTLPVGSYPAGVSVYGVFDMAGNAAEWVFDWYDVGYYGLSSIENPLGPEVGELREARGGSWKNPAVGIRSANRGGNYPEVYSSGIGFRCVIDGD